MNKLIDRLKKMKPVKRWFCYENEILPKLEKVAKDSANQGNSRLESLDNAVNEAATLWGCNPIEIRFYEHGDFLSNQVYEELFKESENEHYQLKRERRVKENKQYLFEEKKKEYERLDHTNEHLKTVEGADELFNNWLLKKNANVEDLENTINNDSPFENRILENVSSDEIRDFFHRKFVKGRFKCLDESQLQKWLKNAFELNKESNPKIEFSNSPSKGEIRGVFYEFSNIYGKYGKKEKFVKLLSDHFAGYDYITTFNNFKVKY